MPQGHNNRHKPDRLLPVPFAGATMREAIAGDAACGKRENPPAIENLSSKTSGHRMSVPMALYTIPWDKVVGAVPAI